MTHFTPPNTRIQYGFPYHMHTKNITYRDVMNHRSLKNVQQVRFWVGGGGLLLLMFFKGNKGALLHGLNLTQF